MKVLTTKNVPVANIIDDNVQLGLFSHIPDNFQCVAEMVFDRLPKSARVLTNGFLTDISKENSIKFFCRKRRASKFFI